VNDGVLVHCLFSMPNSGSPRRMCVPVVDLFAGPGGLGEGFSALEHDSFGFDVVLSVEKDRAAYETLLLRSFFRQLCGPGLRPQYYEYLRGEITRDVLFRALPDEAAKATARCLHLEMGPRATPRVYAHIDRALGAAKHWVLVGGPPCQAYSVVGRSRLAKMKREAFEENDKHVLYREYLRILARYMPPVFVMENVLGLLSATFGGASTFERIVSDLSSPTVAVRQSTKARHPRTRRGSEYSICSLVRSCTEAGPLRPEDYVIAAEKFGIPQKRHRVILLGIRSDLTVPSGLNLRPSKAPVVRDVLSDLPPLRSRLSREEDDADGWVTAIRRVLFEFQPEDLDEAVRETMTGAVGCLRSAAVTGGRWVAKTDRRSLLPPALADWLIDPAMDFVTNHETRRHIADDLLRYLFASSYALVNGASPKLHHFPAELLPNHQSVADALLHRHGFFNDRFRVQVADQPAATVMSHICKDGHYFIHHDPAQCRSWTVREAARVQTFPDNYFFEGPRTAQYRQVGNAVPPYLALQIAGAVASPPTTIDTSARSRADLHISKGRPPRLGPEVNSALQRRRNPENARFLGEHVNPIDTPLCRPLCGKVELVPTQIKRSACRSVGGFHLDESRAAVLIERQNVITGAISVLVGDPPNLQGQVRVVGFRKLPSFKINNKGFPGFAERTVAAVPFDGIKFPNKAA
jgi:DNA (cytosine-5)-methyltransferase 1